MSGLKDAYEYYRWGFGYTGPMEPSSSDDQGGGSGGGGGVTEEQLNAAVSNALRTIRIVQQDNDSFTLTVGQPGTDDYYESPVISDRYFTGVEEGIKTDEDGNRYVNFTMNNGAPPIKVMLEDIDDPNIDCNTF